MSQGLKEKIKSLLETFGLLAVVKFLTRGTPRILMYHRFGANSSARALGQNDFEQQLIYLKENFNVIGLRDLVAGFKAGKQVPNNTVVLTVDDGYRDFYDYAWPLLRKHQIPATFYVTTDFVSHKIWLWPDKIRYILEQTKHNTIDFEYKGKQFTIPLDSSVNKERAWSDLADYCLLLKDEQKHQFIDQFSTSMGIILTKSPAKGYDALTWDELETLKNGGVEIGAHTINHPKLTSLNTEEAKNEIEGSKKELEERLGITVKSFCYPNGTASDYDDETIRLVKSAGFDSATTAFQDEKIHEGLFAIRRMAPTHNLKEFRFLLSGIDIFKRRLSK